MGPFVGPFYVGVMSSPSISYRGNDIKMVTPMAGEDEDDVDEVISGGRENPRVKF